MAIPLKNGVKVHLLEYGKVGNADVWKVGNVFMFVINPNYIWNSDIGAMGWNIDCDVIIGEKGILRRSEDHGTTMDLLIVPENQVNVYDGVF